MVHSNPAEAENEKDLKSKKPKAKKSARGRPAKKKPVGRPKKTKVAAKLTVKAVKKSIEKTVKQPRKPHQTRPTPEEEIAIMDRRYFIWDLYKAGVSFRQIQEHLKSKGYEGTSLGTIHADLQIVLNMQHEDLGLSVKQHIENEVAIINDVHTPFYTILKRNGSNTTYIEQTEIAGKMVLQARDRIIKLRNLHKPPKVELNVDEELARLIGISVEELPEDVD
jgi:hypothetical protein